MKSPSIPPQFALLDGPGNWGDHFQPGSLREITGRLVLRPLPGAAEPLWAEDEPGVLHRASALAVDSAGRILVAETGNHLVHRITLPPAIAAEASPRVLTSATARSKPAPLLETLPAFGCTGDEARHLREPRALAVLTQNEIAVADSGHGRVQLFSPAPYALLEIWDHLPGTPQGLAAGRCGTLYIASGRANGSEGGAEMKVDAPERGPCVQRWARDRLLRTYSRVGHCGDRLRHPTRHAVDARGTIAVVDRDPRDSCAGDDSRLILFLEGQAVGMAFAFPTMARPRAVAFAPDGVLFVGDADGLVHQLEPAGQAASGFVYAGAGDTGLVGEIVDLAWHAERGLLAILRTSGGAVPQRLYAIDPRGACVRQGEVLAGPLDGLVHGRRWHRLAVQATLPGSTASANSTPEQRPFAINVETFTSDAVQAPTNPSAWKPSLTSSFDHPDGLIDSPPGRYLWLKISLRSDGVRSPEIASLRAWFPRESYLEHLPAVFQEDPNSRAFLERFLSIFQTGFDEFDHTIDDFWQRFDPSVVPETLYPWLAAWVDLRYDPTWTLEKKRALLQRAHADYPIRGTVKGLKQAIREYADVKNVTILEHYRLRDFARLPSPPGKVPAYWPPPPSSAGNEVGAPLFGRGAFARMQLGDFSELGVARLASQPEPPLEPFALGAHRFTVYFQPPPAKLQETLARVKSIVEAEKPAHTEAEFRPFLPRLRVGLQSCVGVDTLIGGSSPIVLGELSQLDSGAVLGGTPEEQTMRALGTAPVPILGLQSKLQ